MTPDQVLTPADLLDGRYVILRKGKRDVAAVEEVGMGFLDTITKAWLDLRRLSLADDPNSKRPSAE